jgi:hypothetical protein
LQNIPARYYANYKRQLECDLGDSLALMLIAEIDLDANNGELTLGISLNEVERAGPVCVA